jgi:hypothetical protein
MEKSLGREELKTTTDSTNCVETMSMGGGSFYLVVKCLRGVVKVL